MKQILPKDGANQSAPVITDNKSTCVEQESNSKTNDLKCRVSYIVSLWEEKVGDGEKPLRQSGYRESCLFNNPDPFQSRKDAVIYATGLCSLIENEHRHGGLTFHSPKEAESKGYRNYNAYSVEIYLIDHQENDSIMIYDGDGVPSEDTLGALDSEFFLLESLGYTTNEWFYVKHEGEMYKCINSKAGFVEFDVPDEKPERLLFTF